MSIKCYDNRYHFSNTKYRCYDVIVNTVKSLDVLLKFLDFSIKITPYVHNFTVCSTVIAGY